MASSDQSGTELIADLKSLQRRARALAHEADAIGMLCHGEFAEINSKLLGEIRRVNEELDHGE